MEYYYAGFNQMIHDNVTYGVVAAVAVDGITDWTAHLPEPSLQTAVYLLTIVWLGVQIYYKVRNKK